MATVAIRALSKTYTGGVSAVEDVSLDIADGEFIVLVGPSGCGKSTILRMVAGLETISGGDVMIGGTRVNDQEPGERDIAMVFQNYALYPHMSVFDNMAYGLRNRRMPRAEIEARIQAAAETLQLSDYLKRKPRQLSGGQRQRVAMGRAIVREPKAFLLDEPLSNLDAKLRTHMRSELKQLHRRLGATFLYVTHDQVEAMSLADRIVILNQGKVEQIGAPLDLYDRPASLFVAEFIGSPPMNILDVTGETGRTVAAAAHLPNGAAKIGLRPEALRIGEEGAGLKGRVRLSEALGAETLVHVAIPDGALILRVPASAAPAEGEDVALGFDPSSVCVFDAGGRAL
ncbi:MAG: sn-glycerol-3-phosphate ABC transporter ATP-binding protein UgpC [Pseudomonadota bacterium]